VNGPHAMKHRLSCLGLLACLVLPAAAADWPMYRHDARRSAASPEELPRELFLQWVKQYPRLDPAWPDQPRLRFDVAYEPVAAGSRLFFGSPANDSVTALDAATGAELWRFYADGPVRFAPAYWQGKLYVACDDGCLYCLDAASGTLRWKFRGAPEGAAERLVLGNARLVSLWAARGAPVVHGGKVYFAAGFWPFEGVFLHALDAATGAVAWTNDGSGASYTFQPHSSPAFAGVAPQGYLAVTGGRLLVPCGRSTAACFDLATGKLLYYRLADNQRTGGFLVAANRDSFASGGPLFDLAEGDHVTHVGPAPVMTDDVVYGSDHNDLVAFDVRGRPTRDETDYTAPPSRRWKIRRLWKHRTGAQVHIKAGSRLFAGATNCIEAIAPPQGDEKPKVAWRARIAGTPAALLAADQRLFAVTLEGHIYCFGAARTSARMPQEGEDVLVPFHAAWRQREGGADLSPAWRSVGFDDRLWPLGPPEPPEDDATDAEESDDAAATPKTRTLPTCFRHTFRVPQRPACRALRLEVRADDSTLVHLNGTEVWRRRVPETFGYWTPVSDRAPEEARETIVLDPATLLPGDNVLAVELVPQGYRRTPATFELELTGSRTSEPARPAVPPAHEDEWTQQAQDILRATGAADGYALVVGLRTGRLAEELARRSRLHVVALTPDPAAAEGIRRRLDATGLLGRRVAVRVGDPARLALPPYFASLIASEAPAADPKLVERLFACLRPYGGIACLGLAPEEHEALSRALADGRCERAALSRTGALSLLTRVGALPGAGDWTQQNANAANTLVSKDSRVKLPLGILWFGGSSNEKVLPRHGHGPSPHVVGGRLFIEGPDSLRAMDIYTGRVLWEASLPGLGEAYDNTDHQPGANAIGSNYVSAPDGVYVAYGKTCLRLDPATGRRLAEFALPRLAGDGLLTWGFVTLCDDVLVGGTSPTDFESDPEFSPDEFAKTTKDEIRGLVRWLVGLKGFALQPRGAKEREPEWLARNLNLLLVRTALPASLPKAPSSKARSIERAVAEHVKRRARSADSPPDPAVVRASRELRRLNRLLIEEHCPLLPRKRVLVGNPSVYSGTSSRWLVALDRYSGKVLWTREARDGFLHNSIAIGRGKLFCLDRVPEGVVRSWRWGSTGGGPPKPTFQLLALDLRTGDPVWTTERDVFGTWLAYSEEHDLLIQAGRASRDMLPEPSRRLIAYTGTDGTVQWDEPHRCDGPIMLHSEWLLTQGAAFDLLTGEPRTRSHPLTGEEIPWRFSRQYGCGTAIAAQHLLTFRSAAAGYYDLARDGGTGNFGGFRAGCTSNLIAAGGLLNAPDYTRTCTCSYQNQASLALVHTPEVETWTFNHLKRSDEPIRRVGLNLGAPGDRLADNATLWLEFPIVGGPSPHVPVVIEPDDHEFFTHHSSWALPSSIPHSALRTPHSALPWVAASGAKGVHSLTVTLAGRLTKWRRDHPTVLSRWLARTRRPKSPPQSYTVRLHFVEPDDAAPGDRVFSVSLQGRRVVEALDVAAQAGGPRRPLVVEFRAIEVTDDVTIQLSPAPGSRVPEPVLCGIELVGED